MFQALILRLRLSWRLLRDPRVPIAAKLIPLAAVVYILSPLDLIPDVFVLLGQLDDLGIAIAALRAFELAAPNDVVAEHRAALEGKGAVTIEAGEYSIKQVDEAPE